MMLLSASFRKRPAGQTGQSPRRGAGPQPASEHVLSPRLAIARSLVSRYWRPVVAGAFLVLLSRVCALTIPMATKYIIDKVVIAQNFEILPRVALSTAALLLLQALAAFGAMRIFSATGQRAVIELQTELWTHVCYLPLQFHDSAKTGLITSRIMHDLENVRGLLGSGVADFIGVATSTIVAITVMFIISPVLSISVLVFVLVFALRLRYTALKDQSLCLEHSVVRGSAMARLTEALAGIRVTKASCAEKAECSIMHGRFQRLGHAMLAILNLHALANTEALLLFGVSNIILLYFGAEEIALHKMSVGGFFLFIMVSNTLNSVAFQIISASKQLSEAAASLVRMREITILAREDAAGKRTVSVGRVGGHVRFEDVSFEYLPGRIASEKISFTVSPGTITAIVGRSGSGKSTIANLVAGLYSPSSGTILVDGIDLESVVLDSYRRNLGLVSQEAFLFDGTIEENIAFGRPQATKQDIRQAARLACVEEFVANLENGYQTQLGERGVKLSAGQRQRIAMARSILTRPRILILDEATSNLDGHSEAAIYRALAQLREHVTAIVITHRMSTITHADQILVLEAGRIVERGTHQSLLAAKGHYFELYLTQEERRPHRQAAAQVAAIAPAPGLGA